MWPGYDAHMGWMWLWWIVALACWHSSSGRLLGQPDGRRHGEGIRQKRSSSVVTRATGLTGRHTSAH